MWQKFTSNTGRFTVLMPGAPVEKTRAISSSWGPLEARSFTTQTESGFYLIVYVDYPKNLRLDVEAELDANRDNFIKGIRGELLIETKVMLKGNPGREFSAENAGNYFKSRIYIVGNRVYQLGASSPIGKDDPDSFNKFLTSFDLMQAR